MAGDDDSSFEKRLSGGESGVGLGTAVDDGREVADSEMVHNPIYGSREVRCSHTSNESRSAVRHLLVDPMSAVVRFYAGPVCC